MSVSVSSSMFGSLSVSFAFHLFSCARFCYKLKMVAQHPVGLHVALINQRKKTVEVVADCFPHESAVTLCREAKNLICYFITDSLILKNASNTNDRVLHDETFLPIKYEEHIFNDALKP